MTFNSPHKPSAPYGGGQDFSMCLSDKCVEAIEAAIKAAEDYLGGKRAQLDLGL
jgi:hypothetical protein